MPRRIVLSALALIFVSAGAARAALVQEFDASIAGVRSYGAYTLVLSSRTYDTEGALAPLLERIVLRYPAGVRIRSSFLRGRFFCDIPRLMESPNRRPELCRGSRIGKGRTVIDLRPLFEEALPATVYAFLGKATRARAVASIVVLAIPDRNAPVARKYPVTRDIRPVMVANLFPSRRQHKRFGYRLELPLSDAFSLTELRLAFRGLTRTRSVRSCLGETGPVCANPRRSLRRTFWVTPPACPPSGRLSLEAKYTFLGGLTAERTARLGCSRLLSALR
jgi:hypothetical protein